MLTHRLLWIGGCPLVADTVVKVGTDLALGWSRSCERDYRLQLRSIPIPCCLGRGGVGGGERWRVRDQLGQTPEVLGDGCQHKLILCAARAS